MTPTATAAPPTHTPTATATRRPSRTPPPRREAPSPTATAFTAAAAARGKWERPVVPGLDALAWFGFGSGVTLLATWVGARLARGRERGERRRARRSLATAMLLELRRLDAVLRKMVALDNPASFPSLDHPIMEAALRDLTLFGTETAARIAQFHGALRGIQHDIDEYRDNPLRWAGRLGEFNQTIKGRATATCRAVPELLKALEREGASPPPPLAEPAPLSADATQQLPPPPFGAHESDDWTL